MIKLRELTFCSLLIATMFLMSCQEKTDASLLKHITSKVKNLPSDVTLTVSNNQVYLDGLVESDSVSLAIENKLKNIDGVTSITNNLKVVPGLKKESGI